MQIRRTPLQQSINQKSAIAQTPPEAQETAVPKENFSFSDANSQRNEVMFFTALGAVGGALGAAAGNGTVSTTLATAGATALTNGVATHFARRGTKIASLEVAMASVAGVVTGTAGGLAGSVLAAGTGMNPILAGALTGGAAQLIGAIA